MVDEKLKDYQLLDQIGKGSYGKIIKAKRLSDGLIVAIKKVALDRLTAQEQNDTLNEVKLMQQLDHPNIVKFYDAFLESQTIVIVMEYLGGGDLSKVVKSMIASKEKIDEETLWRYCSDIALGMKYLHDKRILHRDIKTSNMLLDDNGSRIKIGDFGFGKLMGSEQLAYSGVGTPLYMSPELISEQGYNEKSDIWAFGCMLYELASLRPPFNATNQIALAKKISSEVPQALPEQYSREFNKLVFVMLHKNMNHRPNINQVLSYPPLSARMAAFNTEPKEVPIPLTSEESDIWNEITESIGKGSNLAIQLSLLVAKLAQARREIILLKNSCNGEQNQTLDARKYELDLREAKLAEDIGGLKMATEDLERTKLQLQKEKKDQEVAFNQLVTREVVVKKWESELAARENALANREVAANNAAVLRERKTNTPSPHSVRQPLVTVQVVSRLSSSTSCSASSYSSSGSSIADKENTANLTTNQNQNQNQHQQQPVTPIKSPFGTLHELSRENLIAMEQAAPQREDKTTNVRKWVATTPTTPEQQSRLQQQSNNNQMQLQQLHQNNVPSWDHCCSPSFTTNKHNQQAPPLPISPVIPVDTVTTVTAPPPILHRFIDRVAAAPPALPLATPDRPLATRTPKLIQFSGEHFGLCPPLQPGAKIGALFAWRRQQDTKQTPMTARLDSRVSVSSVWGNKEHYSLSPPSTHVLFLVRGLDFGTSHLVIKAIHTKLTRETAFRKIPFIEQKKLQAVFPDHTYWFSIEYNGLSFANQAIYKNPQTKTNKNTGRSEINQFVIEFESPNLVEEVVVTRATKLIGLIEQLALPQQPTPTQQQQQQPIVATPLVRHITPPLQSYQQQQQQQQYYQMETPTIHQHQIITQQQQQQQTQPIQIVEQQQQTQIGPPPMSPRSFTNVTQQFLQQANYLQLQLAEAKKKIATPAQR